jgi:nucleotide-binding universal stress UspA family protein
MENLDKIDRILIATDGSPGSMAAVEEGVRLAKALGAGVTFVAVAHAPLPLLGDPYYQQALIENLAVMRTALATAIPMPKSGTSNPRPSCWREHRQRRSWSSRGAATSI